MRFYLRILRRFLARGPGELFNFYELILAKNGISLIPLYRAAFGAQNETPNAENYKQKVQKLALFVKKSCILLAT